MQVFECKLAIQICIVGNGPVTFLQLVSHMTGLKLQSDWDTQVPPRVINWTKLFAQSHQTLFPPRGWVLGTRLELVWLMLTIFTVMIMCMRNELANTWTTYCYTHVHTVPLRKRAHGQCTLHWATIGGWADIRSISIAFRRERAPR